MRRFTGYGEAPKRLDAILYDDFAEFRAQREAEDARILRFVAGLDETDLAGQRKSNSRSRRRSRISTTTGPVTAGSRTACSPASAATRPRST